MRARAVLTMFAPVPQAEAEAKPEPSRWQAARQRLRQHSRLVAGSALALAAGIATLAFYNPNTQGYATGIGEMRQVSLAEGSSLALDTQTSLKVAIEGDARVVHFDEGRALLRVRHDAARPFRVVAGPVTITDIGTVFQVVRRGDGVSVMVSEGEVEIASPGVRMRLGAGQMVSLDGAGRPVAHALSAAAIERATAWTSGRIELDGERLDTAIDEMNRHNQLKISLGDPALGGEKLYGAFRLDEPEAFARTAALSVGAQARDQGNTIHIAR